ncbi:MAG: hypothetical protein J6T98_01265 [Salinivirgaceae bacterium]|nr:hypothetical protein [Salinivirgaceae bacterium]
MKKETFFRTAVIALLSTSVFVACKDDKSDDNGKVSAADNAVDLGLKSGTKWAKMNVGATNPWDQGSLFAWGETTPKETYEWSTYMHLNNAQVKEGSEWKQINKYQIVVGGSLSDGIWYDNVKFVGDNKTTLDPEDDAAKVNWGGDWATPSEEDFLELRENCEVESTSDYKGTGVAGVIYKANGKEVFFPSIGWISGDFVIDSGRGGRLWANSISSVTSRAHQVWEMDSDRRIFYVDAQGRTSGAGVRAVCKAGGNTNGHDAVDLGLPSGKLWATMNIGAQKVEDYGFYLAWGETEPKEFYSDSTYKYVVKTDYGYSFSKYQVEDNCVGDVWYKKDFVGDGKATLENVDDAAVANWGGKWRMPTGEQMQELISECYWVWTDNYSDTTKVGGYMVFKAKTDANKGKIAEDFANVQSEGYTMEDTHIFLPKIDRGWIWSSSLNYNKMVMSTMAIDLDYGLKENNQGYCGLSLASRSLGLPIRPVCK